MMTNHLRKKRYEPSTPSKITRTISLVTMPNTSIESLYHYPVLPIKHGYCTRFYSNFHGEILKNVDQKCNSYTYLLRPTFNFMINFIFINILRKTVRIRDIWLKAIFHIFNRLWADYYPIRRLPKFE